MEQLIAANILIADRNYRIKIKPEDEESVRKTARIINDKILEFKTNFAGKDMQDYIAMVLIWLATTGQTGGGNESAEVTEKLGTIEKLLDNYLG